MKKQLLHTPDGVRDIYNGECQQKLMLQEKLHEVLLTYGCKRLHYIMRKARGEEGKREAGKISENLRFTLVREENSVYNGNSVV